MNIGPFRYFARAAVSMVLIGTFIGMASAQKPVECKLSDKKQRSVKYFIGNYDRIPATANESAGLVVDIAIEPNRVNQEDLILLASNIKNRFCKEPRITVGIFVRKDVAVRFDPELQEARDALRGEYVLKRATGEEYLSFVNGPDYFGTALSRIRIDLSNEK